MTDCHKPLVLGCFDDPFTVKSKFSISELAERAFWSKCGFSGSCRNFTGLRWPNHVSILLCLTREQHDFFFNWPWIFAGVPSITGRSITMSSAKFFVNLIIYMDWGKTPLCCLVTAVMRGSELPMRYWPRLTIVSQYVPILFCKHIFIYKNPMPPSDLGKYILSWVWLMYMFCVMLRFS